MDTEKPILTCSDLTKFYDPTQIKPSIVDISLKINTGEFVGLSGVSGGGKSTILNILGLADKPSSGRVVLAGEEVDFSNQSRLEYLRKNYIGFVFQAFHLLPTLTALENVLFTPLLKGFSFQDAKSRALALLHSVGLKGKENSLPRQLSGGEMQRVSFCRALAHSPKIILADEPTGNLDSEAGAAVLGCLLIAKNNGVAILMATHSDEALSYCDRVIQIKDGRIR